MGRGLGVVQQFIFDTLSGDRGDHWWHLEMLVRERYGREPTAAEVETIRRAVRTLTRRKLVEVTPVPAPSWSESRYRRGRPLGVRLSRAARGRQERRERDERRRERDELLASPEVATFQLSSGGRSHLGDPVTGRTLCGLPLGTHQPEAGQQVTCRRCRKLLLGDV